VDDLRLYMRLRDNHLIYYLESKINDSAFLIISRIRIIINHLIFITKLAGTANYFAIKTRNVSSEVHL